MVVKRSEMKRESKPAMRGGEGVAEITHFVDGSSMKNARLLSEITLAPGASIGDHRHDSETEYYLIVSGEGTVLDEGVPKKVAAGDVVVTGDGATHSIRNDGKVPLVFHAVIVTY